MTDRFDRFTERARKVLQLAQEEAQRFNHNYIGTEHILLGLVRETEGVAARVLADLGLELDDTRAAVEAITNHKESRESPISKVRKIDLTDEARGAIEAAVEEARELSHNYVGTEHLLLGILRDGRGIAVDVLKSFDLSPEVARAMTLHALGLHGGSPLPDRESLMERIRHSMPFGHRAGALGKSIEPILATGLIFSWPG